MYRGGGGGEGAPPLPLPPKKILTET